jgi:hypothetical protein
MSVCSQQVRKLTFFLLVVLSSARFVNAAAAGIPGKFYEYHIIGATGQTPTNASGPLTGMGDNPSINANGSVAFVAQFSNGQGVAVGDGSGSASVLINPSFVGSTRNFGRAVKINDSGNVMANDRVTGNPPLYFERPWSTTTLNSASDIAKGGPPYTWDAVFNQGAVNSQGDAVFGALDKQGNTVLVVVTQLGFVHSVVLPVNSLPRPMISDDSLIIGRLCV